MRPEVVRPGMPQWERYRLHNAANIYHLQRRLGLTAERQRKYKVAWVGGCVLYHTAALRECGGFGFWRELPPEHCGEDVLAQLRVMARHGGCGIIPSGVYHQELPTTIPNRRHNAPVLLAGAPPERGPERRRDVIMDRRGVLPNLRKMAVLRANGIGDFILALPTLEALRSAYPQAQVVLLGRRWHRDFLTGRPGPVDRVVVVPTCRGVTEEPGRREDPEELARFFEEMAQEGFDLALQLHGGEAGAPTPWSVAWGPGSPLA